MSARPRPALALDLGGTKVAAAVVQADGTLRHRRQVPTNAAAGPEAVLAILIAQARQLYAPAPDAHAVGIGSAGQIDAATGRVIYANDNLPGWTGMEVGRRVQDSLGLPVYVDNDVNAMALAEAVWGAGAGRRVVLVVAVGTGVGGALVFDGRLFRGASGVAGEVGHIPVTSGGPVCACGRRGCLEVYAAGPRIAAAYGRAMRLEHPVELPEVTARARSGDRTARATIAAAGRRIGWALTGIVNTLNPDVIIVGGGVVATGDLLLDSLRDSLSRHAQAPAAAAVTILPALLGADAGLLGAALLTGPAPTLHPV